MKTLVRILAAAALMAALLSCKLFDYSNITSKKFALVYGVTAYVSPTDSTYVANVTNGTSADPNLSYPDADAQSLATLLRGEGYTVVARWVDASGKEYLTTSAGTPVPVGTLSSDASGANGPSKANIPLDIANYFAGVMGSDDTFLFYFSGHGTQDTTSSPLHEFFVPEGAVQWDSSQDEYAAYKNDCVRDDEMGGYLNALKTPRKIVVLDTCNSGGFIGNQLESDWTPSDSVSGPTFVSPGTLIEAISNYADMSSSSTGLSPYGAMVLSASGRDESSYEWDNWKHGVMTYWLLQGLEGSADLNKDGHITALEAFAYAKSGVDNNWNDTDPVASDGTSAVFEPHVSGGPVDFVLF
ncbi:MAG TPA: caspase family protein [Spirochaetia bacterium]|nr:caspase family protein [Spirochaetia bacterium]